MTYIGHSLYRTITWYKYLYFSLTVIIIFCLSRINMIEHKTITHISCFLSLAFLYATLSSATNAMAAQAASNACAAVGAGAAGAAGVAAAAGLIGAIAGASTGVQIGVVVGTVAAVAGSITGGVTASQQQKNGGATAQTVVEFNTTVLTVPTMAPLFSDPITFAPIFNGPTQIPGNILASNQTASPSFALCDVNPEFKKGFVSILFNGIGRNFNDTEGRALEGLFEETYNLLSKGCDDIYQRHLENATLAKQTINSSDGSREILETNWEAWVRCKGCPNQQPLFSDLASRRKLSKNTNSINFGTWVEIFGSHTDEIANTVILEAMTNSSNGKKEEIIFFTVQPTSSPTIVTGMLSTLPTAAHTGGPIVQLGAPSSLPTSQQTLLSTPGPTVLPGSPSLAPKSTLTERPTMQLSIPISLPMPQTIFPLTSKPTLLPGSPLTSPTATLSTGGPTVQLGSTTLYPTPRNVFSLTPKPTLVPASPSTSQTSQPTAAQKVQPGTPSSLPTPTTSKFLHSFWFEKQ
jgi:hypothetical protein